MQNTTTSETTRIADQITRMAEGGAWHGPSIRDNLTGVTAQQAAARPISGAHTIWEIVHHLTAWANEVEGRLQRDAHPLHGEEDWPPVTATDDAAWETARAALHDAHARLRMAVREFPASRLGETVPGTDPLPEHSFHVLLHGLAQHDAYHTGQIAILKRASG